MRKGLTLAEIIIVLALLGVMLGLAYWGGHTWVARNRVKNEAYRLRSVIMGQRIKALSRQIKTGIFFDPQNYTYTLFDIVEDSLNPGTYDTLITVSEHLARNIYFGSSVANGPGGVSVPDDGVAFNNPVDENQVIFNPFGACETPGEVYLTDKTYIYALQIHSTGKVSIYRWKGDSWYEED